MRLTTADYTGLHAHLFPGDGDEHGAVLLAGVSEWQGSPTLLVREVHHLNSEEFVPGNDGYRQFAAATLARLGNRAEAERLALVSCHSHPGATTRVGLSRDDLAGHRRVFPHLLDIVHGQPVAGIAFGSSSAAGELWMSREEQLEFDSVQIVGETLERLGQRPGPDASAEARFDRQVRMFGAQGQRVLRGMTVAVVGVGGGGSIVTQQLAHLGVGTIVAIDFDRVEAHNLSRIVGARRGDARRRRKKIEIARRLVRDVDPSIGFEGIDGDIADSAVASRLSKCDFIFLCTDTITSRLVANAVAQAHLIPMIQIGAKIDRPGTRIESIYVAVRPSYPRRGCLACAGMIDPVALQREGADPDERAAQNYLNAPDVVDPSVITLNAIAASAATNLMLMSAVGLATSDQLAHRLFDAQTGRWLELEERRDPSCLWCGSEARSRFGRGADARLPVRPQAPRSARRPWPSRFPRRRSPASHG